MKLVMSDYEVEWIDDNGKAEFHVHFGGPEETVYEGGHWKVHVELPPDYPYRSPSIGFLNRIFHPNVDELSGSVCLDVINQTWSPMYDLVNIFDVFIPQLLRYPNAADPLNSEAAALLLDNPEDYAKKVKDMIARYATRTKEGSNSKCAKSHNSNDDDDDDADDEKQEDAEAKEGVAVLESASIASSSSGVGNSSIGSVLATGDETESKSDGGNSSRNGELTTATESNVDATATGMVDDEDEDDEDEDEDDEDALSDLSDMDSDDDQDLLMSDDDDDGIDMDAD